MPTVQSKMETLEYCATADAAYRMACEATASSNDAVARELYSMAIVTVVQPKLRSLGSDLGSLPLNELVATMCNQKSKRMCEARKDAMSDPDLLKIILESAPPFAAIRFSQTSREIRQWIAQARPKIHLGDKAVITHAVRVQQSGLWTMSTLSFSCSRTIKNFKFLSTFTKLESLNLGGTNISNVAPLAGLVDLKILIVRYTGVANIALLSRLVKLEALDLDHCWGLADIKPIAGFVKLKRLGLKHTSVTTIEALAGLVELEALRISDMGVTDITPLAGLVKLTDLSLNHCKDLTDVTPLAGLVKLTHVNLMHTSVTTIEPLAGLVQLKMLKIRMTGVTNVTHLAGLVKLEDLDLAYCRDLTDITPLAGLVKLKSLSLSGTEVTQIAPLAGLFKLETLYFNTAITDLDSLSHLASLEIH